MQVWEEIMQMHKRDIGYTEEPVIWHQPVQKPPVIKPSCRCFCHQQSENVRCTSCHMCDCYKNNKRDRN